MIDFNPDGSIKIPGHMQKRMNEHSDRMNNSKCIIVKKEVVNFTAPKKCILHVMISEKMENNSAVVNGFAAASSDSQTPMRLRKISEKEFEIEVGTNFRRCSDCTALIGKLKHNASGNLIKDKGNCTYRGFSSNNFCYEDHFE